MNTRAGRDDALEEAGEDAAERRGEAEEERFEADIERLEDDLDAREDDYVSAAFSDVWSGRAFDDGVNLAKVHVLLGLSLLAMGVLRLMWRATTPLPP